MFLCVDFLLILSTLIDVLMFISSFTIGSIIIGPRIIQATVNYSTGYFEFISDETMDVTPLNLVNTTSFLLMDSTGSTKVLDMRNGIRSLTTDPINLQVEHQNYIQTRDGDTTRVGIYLNENERIATLLESSVPGK